ncbi:MAG: NAD-dependent epimerase/dehydratase family protein [Myxococcota bacterium]
MRMAEKLINTERTILKSRPDRRKEWILITGISSNIGRRLTKHLHKTESIIGVDNRPFPDKPKDVLHFQHELWRKRTEAIFRQQNIKAVIHIAVMHNPRTKTRQHHSENIMGIARLLEYCKRYEIPKVVVLSSATVYGAIPDNDAYLTEESPLRGGRRFMEVRDLIEMDMFAQSFFWKAPKVKVMIIRPVHIVGEEIKNTPSNYLRMNPVPVIAGFDPMIQLIYIDDLIYAMERCLKSDVRGVFNIVGGGAAPLRSSLKAVGKKIVEIPAPLLKKFVSIGWDWKFTTFPPEEINYIHYGCMVDGSRAERELGYKARFPLKETLERIVNSTVDM